MKRTHTHRNRLLRMELLGQTGAMPHQFVWPFLIPAIGVVTLILICHFVMSA